MLIFFYWLSENIIKLNSFDEWKVLFVMTEIDRMDTRVKADSSVNMVYLRSKIKLDGLLK